MSKLLGREPFLGADILVHAFENFTDAVQIDDIEGAVYYVNAAWTALFGNTPDLPSGVTREHLGYAGVDTAILDQSWITCLETGVAHDSIAINTPRHPLKTLDVTRTLYKNSEGEPLAVLTVYRSTSGNEFRQYVSEFLTQVVPRNEGSIAFLEPTGHIIAANLSFALTVGVNKSDTFGQHIERFIDSGRDIIERADKTYAGLTEKASVLRQSGTLLDSTVSVRRVKNDSGTTLGFIVRIQAT